MLHYTPAITCRPDDAVLEAAAIMRDSGAGSVVVTDDHDHLLGVLTDRDIVIRAVGEGRPMTMPVHEIMTRDVTFICDTEDVVTATSHMVQRQCRRLPVLSVDGSVMGVVAMDDLLQVFARQVDMLATVAGHATAWEPVKPRV